MSIDTSEDVEPAQGDPAEAGRGLRFRFPGYQTEVGPVGHLQPERERLAALEWDHFDVKPLGATIGAELTGVDLRGDLPQEVIDEIRQALLDFKVIFFRDQNLDPDQHVAFARRFGQLEVHPFIPANDQRPELVRFEKSPKVGGYENGWHSDVSWREVPSLGAVLHAISVPPSGGDTLFADMCAVYEGLAADVRNDIADLHGVHDFSQVFGHQVKAGERDEMRKKYPPVRHPVVRTHPETGRKLLYVNRFFVSHVEGMELDESRTLVDLLCRGTDLPEYQCRFHWEPNSVAFWDNRAVQHYATSDYWPAARVMQRASIIGDRPI